jgi:curved DNA-binding protein CbpA
MSEREFIDFYEVLQVSPSAEPETIHSVYRLLAQRWHPENKGTGDLGKFRAVQGAFDVLSDPEQRAQFDVQHEAQRQSLWRHLSSPRSGDNFEVERSIRLAILEILYKQRLTKSNAPGVFLLDLERLLGAGREHVEFALWYLQQKELVQRTENSRIAITASGVDYLEDECKATSQRSRRSSSGIAAA